MNQASFTFAERSIPAIATQAYRNTDPDTSRLAAEAHTASGKRAHQQAQAIAAVRSFPGSTSFELALKTDLCRFLLARRLPEAETAGAVRKGEARACSVTGRRAVTWWAA